MSKYGDNERYTPPVYAGGSSIRKNDINKNNGKSDDAKDSDTDNKDSKSDSNDTDTSDDTDTEDDTSNNESDTDNSEESESECEFKTWLEVLPSKGGLLLAAVLVEIMTDGLTPNQMNILGNFVASVGTLISYKASRDELDVN